MSLSSASFRPLRSPASEQGLPDLHAAQLAEMAEAFTRLGDALPSGVGEPGAPGQQPEAAPVPTAEDGDTLPGPGSEALHPEDAPAPAGVGLAPAPAPQADSATAGTAQPPTAAGGPTEDVPAGVAETQPGSPDQGIADAAPEPPEQDTGDATSEAQDQGAADDQPALPGRDQAGDPAAPADDTADADPVTADGPGDDAAGGGGEDPPPASDGPGEEEPSLPELPPDIPPPPEPFPYDEFAALQAMLAEIEAGLRDLQRQLADLPPPPPGFDFELPVLPALPPLPDPWAFLWG